MVRLLVDENFGARGGEGGAVVVEGAVDLGVSGEVGVEATAPEEIEGDDGLWEELVPEGEVEAGIGAA